MKNGSFFVPREELGGFLNPAEMNSCEGLTLLWETDPAAARRILPPPLDLADPEHPVASAYVINIREPSFAPWYMEACLGLACRYRDKVGGYLISLQLSGPGATMGMCSGRETGLPKKLCERIVVERNGDWAHACVEAKGRRIFDVETQLNPPGRPEWDAIAKAKRGARERGSCFLFKSVLDASPGAQAKLSKVSIVNYDSETAYESFEPGLIASIAMEPSLDDPWAEISVVKPLYAYYSVYSNPVLGNSVLAEFEGEAADRLFPFLFTGRWDRSTLCKGHQRYGQF